MLQRVLGQQSQSIIYAAENSQEETASLLLLGNKKCHATHKMVFCKIAAQMGASDSKRVETI